jgi:hypothetical protein
MIGKPLVTTSTSSVVSVGVTPSTAQTVDSVVAQESLVERAHQLDLLLAGGDGREGATRGLHAERCGDASADSRTASRGSPDYGDALSLAAGPRRTPSSRSWGMMRPRPDTSCCSSQRVANRSDPRRAARMSAHRDAALNWCEFDVSRARRDAGLARPSRRVSTRPSRGERKLPEAGRAFD